MSFSSAQSGRLVLELTLISRGKWAISRRRSLAWLGTAAGTLLHRQAFALEPEVPIPLQVSLLDRVIPFDRNFHLRAIGHLSMAVVVDERDGDSVRIGAQLLNELSARESLGNYRVSATRVAFKSTAALIEDCRRLKAGVVYVTPGIAEATPKLAAGLRGMRVLTVGSLPEQVPQGLVLGSAVRSGKPRVLVNLSEARQQEIDFRADFLRMAEVVG